MTLKDFGTWYTEKWGKQPANNYTWNRLKRLGGRGRHDVYGKPIVKAWLMEVAKIPESDIYEEVQFTTDRGNPIADFVFKFEGIWMIGELKTQWFGNNDAPSYTKAQTTGYPQIAYGEWTKINQAIAGLVPGTYVPISLFRIHFSWVST